MDEDEIDYNDINIDFIDPINFEEDPEFESMWEKETNATKKDEYVPPSYNAANSVALQLHLCQIVNLYMGAKHGQSMKDVFDQLEPGTFIEEEVEFNL